MYRTVGILILLLSLLPCRAASPMSPINKAVDVPPKSERIEGYTNVDSIKAWIKSRPLSVFEGIWTLPEDESVVMTVEKCPYGYRIVWLESDDRMLLPGTVVGYIQPTAKAGTATAYIYSKLDKDYVTLLSPKPYVVSLDETHGRLVFKEIKKGLKIDFWRIVPWQVRGILKHQDNSPDNSNGLMRVYPIPEIPLTPIYL
ncbi:MAG: hypothetical protein HUK13_08415 [Muribaculaceae bacterium]|nr:hypothetical protein [Muribaculaceae bacterium]